MLAFGFGIGICIGISAWWVRGGAAALPVLGNAAR